MINKTSSPSELSRLLPGLGVVAIGVALSFAVHALAPALSPLMVALLLGALLTNIGLHRPRLTHGFRFATRTPLRAGIVLLGLQLAILDILALGGPVLAVILVSTTATFLGTVLAGRRLGVSRERGLLVAAGVSICGASAVAAMNDTVRGDEDDVMTSVAMVTIFGTLDVLLLPLVGGLLGFDARSFGIWSGASVHEVGQVVAVAGSAGAAALAPAVIVKLTRVMLLAPVIVGVGLWLRRGDGGDGDRVSDTHRPPLMPLFVVGFLVAVALSSTGVVPEAVRAPAKVLQDILLCAGLFGMGTSANIRNLLRTSGPSLLLGAAGTALILIVTYLGVTAVT